MALTSAVAPLVTSGATRREELSKLRGTRRSRSLREASSLCEIVSLELPLLLFEFIHCDSKFLDHRGVGG